MCYNKYVIKREKERETNERINNNVPRKIKRTH